MRRPGQRIDRKRDGTFVNHLAKEERELLASLADQLRTLVTDGTDDGLRRLRPPAYLDDAEAEAEYRRMVGDELTAARLARIDGFTQSLRLDRLAEEQVVGWMGVVNDIRLVLGTNLDVTEDMAFDDFADDDPALPAYSLYTFLSMLLDQIVEELDG